MQILTRVVLPISLVLFIAGFWNRDVLHADIDLDPVLFDAPVQTAIEADSYETRIDDEIYEVVPLYDYEINGLVVSYNVHSSVSLMHRSGHQLNVADYCIVWGDNVLGRDLSAYEFWNQEFTCNFRWRADTEPLALDQISNNHLISDDPYIRTQLRKINIGDQLRLRGRLADYRNVSQPHFRKTSTVRDDKGNGACETLIVDSVEVLSTYTSTWRMLMYIAGLVFVGVLALYLVTPHRTRG